MTGSLKAEPPHAVPAPPPGLMGDQWAVGSANSRAEQEIQEKNTELRRMKACEVQEIIASQSVKSDSGTPGR